MAIKQSLFGGGDQHLIGLDISSSAVKLLELSRKGERFHVEAYAVEPLPPNAVSDKQITEPQLVADAIGRAVNRAGTRTRQAAVAVSGTAVISKLIEMPSSLSEDELEEQIRAEADQYIPYPIDEVNVDFEIVGPNAKNSEMSDVLLAACRKEFVDQRCAAIELAGLKPKVVDIETYSLENASVFLEHQMPDGGRGKTIAIVDVGGTTSTLLVLHDGHTIYTRDQSFGGRQLTEDIMRHYAMGIDEAERGKRDGTLPADYAEDVLPGFIADMAMQIERSLQFFFSAVTQYTQIDQIILAGGCAQITGIDAAIQERLQIPTVTARPFGQMSVGSRAKPALLARDEPSLLIACGLAFRAFDEPRP
ncbi:pilus assembly protein PilM [Solimonas marina]|uniref:Pilus assembly protein PilM n=1 Tax=Solimonas marina TaxID=2714601 RepID=A0A970B896_9GAMM|nr:pilus assembly protein PilM [Solimonas marina]NKF21156.1 pilus assembly protein PilM [Solimonas marina]